MIPNLKKITVCRGGRHEQNNYNPKHENNPKWNTDKNSKSAKMVTTNSKSIGGRREQLNWTLLNKQGFNM